MKVTITEELYVARWPDVVWDFTQDYTRRTQWDRSILEAHVLDGGPLPRIRIRAAGMQGVFEYKLFDRPRRTSLALVDVKSWLIAGGGGSWSYEAVADGTLWTQTNSLAFKSRVAGWLLGPIARFGLRRSTHRAMLEAKRILEGTSPQDDA